MGVNKLGQIRKYITLAVLSGLLCFGMACGETETDAGIGEVSVSEDVTASTTEETQGEAPEDGNEELSVEASEYGLNETCNWDEVLEDIAYGRRFDDILYGCNKAEYGFYDVNGDNVDELIIEGKYSGLYILMWQDNEVKEVFNSYRAVLLEDGSVWYCILGGAPKHTTYNRYVFDGTEYQKAAVYEVYDGDEDGSYSENGEGDLYFYYDCTAEDAEEQTLTKEEWDGLTEPYINGSEAVLRDTGVLEAYTMYYVEEDVCENPLFAQFINGEVKAYDNVQDTGEYSWFGTENYLEFYGSQFSINDLYSGYRKEDERIDTIHILTEDFSGDGKDELILIVTCNKNQGMVHVFHEEEGNLYAWEPLYCWGKKDISLRVYSNGMIEWCHGNYGQYNEDGYFEVALTYTYRSELVTTGERENYFTLNIYEDGITVKTIQYMQYEHCFEKESECTPENLAIKEEFDAVFNQFKEENGEEKIIYKIYKTNVDTLEGAQMIQMGELIGE